MVKKLVCLALVVPSVALASGPRPPAPLVVATATSAQAKSPAWGAIDNVADGRGWCPAKGDGVGEAITLTFDHPIPIKSLDLYLGTVKEVEITAGAQKLVASRMTTPLDGSAVSSLTLKIKSVTGGKKPTCLTGVRALSPSDWFYPFIYGVDAAAAKALPATATRLDAALRACDPAALTAAIAFPLVHEREHPGIDDNAEPGPTERYTYKSAAELVRACQTTTLASGYVDGTFDDALASALADMASPTAGQVKVGRWTFAFANGAWHLTAIDTIVSAMTVLPDGQRVLTEPKARGELYTPDARFHVVSEKTAVVDTAALATTLRAPDQIAKRMPENDVPGLARDGQTAWEAIDYPSDAVPYRVTYVLVRTPQGWRIAGGMFSVAQPNQAINAAGKAGKLSALPAIANDGDPSLQTAFKALLATGFDKDAVARKDLVAIGSGPGERTTTGAAIAKPWAATWTKHAALVGGISAHLAPSGTTGWTIADVALDKTGYKLPFRVMVVFDKTAASTWTVVEMHLAVPGAI